MMKKTLVALAAVAVTGGAFAQAVMTGGLAFGYSQKTTSAGAQTSGLGADGANVNFAVTEDIEGLGTISGKMGVTMKNADTSAVGRDSNIALNMGSSGTIKMESVYSNSWLGGVASTGSVAYCGFSSGDCSTGIGMFSSYGYNDNFSYSVPVGPVSVSFAYTEPNGTAAGLGAGAAGSYLETGAASQRYVTYSLSYKTGGLTAQAGYRTYDNASAATTNNSVRNRAAFAYDLGVATIGAGYEQTSTTYGDTSTDSLISVAMAVPNTPLTISAQSGTKTKAGNKLSSADTSFGGQIYAASYSLSKRTSMGATYVTNSSSGTSNPNFFIATLSHSF